MIKRYYDGPLVGPMRELQKRIVACRNCWRLVEYRERKATNERRASFKEWDYWGAAVPSHGDPKARLLLIGLAPASHGANRTGRLFTGDPTADFLTKSLHRAGFASQPNSFRRDDGLVLQDAFEVAVVRCAPPNDKPTPQEQRTCRPYLQQEIDLLPNIKVALVFGRVAFENFIRAMRERTGSSLRYEFKHGAIYDLGKGFPALFASYHPSPRNTNTGRLTVEQLDAVLDSVNAFLARTG